MYSTHHIRSKKNDRLRLLRPVRLDDGLLVHLAHSVALDGVHDLEHRRDLVRRHLLLQLRAEGLEVKRVGL